MSVSLRKRMNRDGTTSLRLDIYANGSHRIETLKHLQLDKVVTAADRANNKEKLRLAEQICLHRNVELEANNYNVQSDAGKKVIVVDWLYKYAAEYNKKDIRNIEGVIKRFADFLMSKNLEGLTFGKMTPLVIEDFIDYLENKSVGEGAKSYYSRFKKMIRYAYRSKIIKENILDFVTKTPKGKAREKDTLTKEDVQLLAQTPTSNDDIKRAFLFSCVTGLRWIDVKNLTFANINFSKSVIQITQTKTKMKLTAPLNETAILLIGKKGSPEQSIFNLPSANGCNKTIKAWVKRANIEAKITWHNARHSFGTNLADNGVGVLDISALMGHSTIQQANRYVKASKDRKQKATDTLNIQL